MAKNTKNAENKQKYCDELEKDRNKWHEQIKELTDRKNVLGYKDIGLQQFIDRELIKKLKTSLKSDEQDSELVSIHNDYRNLDGQYKLLWPEEWVISEINKKHAVIHIDQTYILTEKEDTYRKRNFTIESRYSFRNFYEDEIVVDSRGNERCKADIWLKSPKRRKYEGIVFDPKTTGHLGKYYNIWRGFAKDPKPGDTGKYWAHVHDNICAKNDEHYFFVRKWLAYVFQHPDVVHTALVLCGSQGVGKNMFVEPLGQLLGDHYALLSSIEWLVSHFNYHLKNAVLIHANEALWGGNKKDLGKVKSMITEQNCLIEGKGKDPISVKNFKHLILSSNEDWPVHIDRDDRRFFVLAVSDARKEDHEYFEALQNELDNGGYEGLLYDLLNEQLEGFDPREFPHSSAAFDIKMRSEISASRFIYHALLNGTFDIEGGGEVAWREVIPKMDVFVFYKEWCGASEEKVISYNLFCASVKKIIEDVSDYKPTIDGKRASAYHFPSLEQARNNFCKSFKVNKEEVFSS